jgi:predicted ATP-dependent serine protease
MNIDSVNTLNLDPHDLEKLPKNKAYAYIFQCTKDGNYRGSQEFEYNADTVIEVADMTAKMHKNRFGGKEKELKI